MEDGVILSVAKDLVFCWYILCVSLDRENFFYKIE